MTIDLKVHNSYHLRFSSSNGKVLCHIEAILFNTVEFFEDSEIVVFRYWLKRKQRWERKAMTKQELLIWNDEEYVEKLLEQA